MMKKVLLVLLAAIILASPGISSAQQSPGDFIDTRGHWAEQAIEAVSNLGLMNGTGTTDQGLCVFSPEGPVSRAQLATVLQQTFQLDYGQLQFIKQPLASDYYSDVDNEAWYANGLVMCAINNIFATSGDFSPDRSVSRMEIARAVYRSFNAKGISVPMIMIMPNYEDTTSLSQEDTNAVTFVSNTGIMKGNHNYFRPESNITRAELATILMGCINLREVNEASIIISNNNVKTESPTMSVDLHIPVISGLTDNRIQSKINAQWEKHALDLEKELAAEIDSYVKYNEQNDFPIRPYQLVTRYQECYQNDNLLSLYVDYYQYTGGAHGMTNRQPYNIDLHSGNELAIKDLFQADYDYQSIINKEIRAQIALNPGNYFTDNMGFNGITENQSYYIQNGVLVVYFSQYEIAPYAAGIPEFKIPLSNFQDGIRADLLQ